MREGVSLEPVLYGGGQEKGLRSGTQNVAGIVGLGAAATLASEEMDDRVAHERAMRDRIMAGIEALPDVFVNGHRGRRLSNNVHLTVSGVEAESLVLFLDCARLRHREWLGLFIGRAQGFTGPARDGVARARGVLRRQDHGRQR